MKTMLIVSISALVPAVAMAHPSMMPHEHPHAISMLPDIAAVMMAAVMVGVGALVLARSKRARK
jgi:hypothetical protein